jgi:nucleotide-binding universal stress UspA family protein
LAGINDRRQSGDGAVTIVVWITEGVWEAAVDGARTIAPADAEITLLYVHSGDMDELVQGAFAGLIGRRRRVPSDFEQKSADFSDRLLSEAKERLGRDAHVETRHGRIEREVVTASAAAELLVLSRDGDRSRLGPHSLGPVSRFIVDHAACPVLLVWPGVAPSADSLPPPPPEGAEHPPPPEGAPHPPPHAPPPAGGHHLC